MDDQRAYGYTCPNCGAQPGQKCTEPTNDSRRPVTYIHFAREAQVERDA